MSGAFERVRLPRLGDERIAWQTKQNKEEGEVMVAGGNKYIVVKKVVLGVRSDGDGRKSGGVRKVDGFLNERCYAYGAYNLIEEGTDEPFVVNFEYPVGQEEANKHWKRRWER